MNAPVDFELLSQLQRQLLRDMSHSDSNDLSANMEAISAPAAGATILQTGIPSQLEHQMSLILKAHPHPFSKAVSQWQHHLHIHCFHLFEAGISAEDEEEEAEEFDDKNGDATLSSPRPKCTDAQIIEEALPFLDFSETLVSPNERYIVLRASRAIKEAFSEAVQKIKYILHIPHTPQERAKLLAESDVLLDRARTAGCGGGTTTLRNCLRTFHSEDILHVRAVSLLERLKHSSTEPQSQKQKMNLSAAVQGAERKALQAATLADTSLMKMSMHSGERALSVLIALKLGT
jgi:hypothetical protein